MSFDDLRKEALKKAELSGFGHPTSFCLSPISNVLSLFPPRPERDQVDPTKKFGRASIAGRIILRRDAGRKLIFLTVQDRDAQMQVVLNAALLGTTLDALRQQISVWDVMAFSGELSFSNSGEPSLWADSAEFMAKSIRPAPDKVAGIVEKESRYRQRYLDLICDAESRNRFIDRAKIIASLRSLLDGLQFIEVETPILQIVPNGASARPFETHLNALDLDMRLRIATEIALKKLMVGGLERVYEIGRIFRNEGIDKSHNPEFTSVELYQAYAGLGDMQTIVRRLIGAEGVNREYVELIREHAEVDPWNAQEIRRVLDWKRKNEERMPVNLDKETDAAVLDALFSEFVEPKLQEPTFVFHQPVEQSPLCKAWSRDPRLAERFELYMNGMEIANAYQELNDPLEQRKRLEAQGVIDEDFIEALEFGMPACAGMGIGIDRLVMVLTKAPSIRDVILFPLMRP